MCNRYVYRKKNPYPSEINGNSQSFYYYYYFFIIINIIGIIMVINCSKYELFVISSVRRLEELWTDMIYFMFAASMINSFFIWTC